MQPDKFQNSIDFLNVKPLRGKNAMVDSFLQNLIAYGE